MDNKWKITVIFILFLVLFTNVRIALLRNESRTIDENIIDTIGLIVNKMAETETTE